MSFVPFPINLTNKHTWSHCSFLFKERYVCYIHSKTIMARGTKDMAKRSWWIKGREEAETKAQRDLLWVFSVTTLVINIWIVFLTIACLFEKTQVIFQTLDTIFSSYPHHQNSELFIFWLMLWHTENHPLFNDQENLKSVTIVCKR